MKKFKCPYCGKELDSSDNQIVSFDFLTDKIILYVENYCPECNKDFSWTEEWVCSDKRRFYEI